MKIADKQIETLKAEKTTLETELAGGTLWTRTKRALKWIGIGGGIALAATCGTGHCK